MELYFFNVLSQVTWRTHERLIDANKGHLILALHFHLSEGVHSASE